MVRKPVTTPSEPEKSQTKTVSRAKSAVKKPAAKKPANRKPAAKTKAQAKAAAAAREKAQPSTPPAPSVMEAWRASLPQPGSRIWEVTSSMGRNPKFESAEQLWRACIEYFEWAEDNPLTEAKPFPTKDEVRVEMFPKLRAMTIGGLCIFLDISTETWRLWKTRDSAHARPDLFGVIERVEEIIVQQKLTAASVGLLNANIIARELGLADKSEISGKDGAPIQHAVKARVVMLPPKVPAVVSSRPMDDEEGEA